MKIVTILGARPQFIKSAPVSKAILNYNKNIASNRAPVTEIIIHTGQHFDANMSDVFFEELDISKPAYHLGINRASHAAMTGRMLEKIEEILIKEKPDWVLVYGDTNSTLAGALAAAKLRIPIAHVEAGLRSFNREMPEEINRILTDHCADVLFCPTKTAIDNLRDEGFSNILINGTLYDKNSLDNETSDVSLMLSPVVINVGDIMYDAVLHFSKIAQRRSTILEDMGFKSKEYFLATIHRPNNTDALENFSRILSAFLEIDEPIIFPVHPRTRQCLNELKLDVQNSCVRFISPVGYFDMLALEKNARVILTDSGGIQKEAYWFGVPCVTLRAETEWKETVESGWNVVVGANREKILEAMQSLKPDTPRPKFYGYGQAADKIFHILTAKYLPTSNYMKQ